ncbi:polysaccharide deacetylase family protein [Mucilaginibacter ginkgonis]|uniref:Polysaccharide deacetylase family protein n=1 Tax=Mucilaginibacter ginkgonis TaxID=2682091 RepID=A0A6I4I283_9SPHI|nr:polysaccharide deacetylase family protein [Mucilaginibacter ginkgonis]QQL50825.1 polysaccharide deacetylase family protein [Mucilaginibacter ginkgonis]
MSKLLSSILPLCLLATVACKSNNSDKSTSTTVTKTTSTEEVTTVESKSPGGPIASKATIMSRAQVPIVCYHQIRDWKATDSKGAKDYIVQIQAFKDHMKMLADSGYHTILPDQLYNYLAYGAALPKKPIMLTFDDTDVDQFTIARPEMKKYGFKGVFFIMTVSIGRPHYMSKEQIKQLSDEGNVIASHTWDHHNFKKFAGKDWETQIDKPTKKLAEITGKEVKYFAYPFGLWNEQGLPELHKRGFKLAFQLAEKRDANDPLMTVRRILDSGYWSTKTFGNNVRGSF